MTIHKVLFDVQLCCLMQIRFIPFSHLALTVIEDLFST